MAAPAARPSIQFLIRCRIGGTPERILISPEQTSGRSKLNQDGKSLSFPLRRGGVRDGAMPHPSARPPPQ
ncbi:hypothetical protein, partial [Brevundimonas sp.]|uniref:hypothetical protein n=1 Tax=Brevundimonas sp. TaxID=1871086 RepID=UPI00257FE664